MGLNWADCWAKAWWSGFLRRCGWLMVGTNRGLGGCFLLSLVVIFLVIRRKMMVIGRKDKFKHIVEFVLCGGIEIKVEECYELLGFDIEKRLENLKSRSVL